MERHLETPWMNFFCMIGVPVHCPISQSCSYGVVRAHFHMLRLEMPLFPSLSMLSTCKRPELLGSLLPTA